MTEILRNWAGHFAFGAGRFHAPTNIADIQRIVHDARKIRVAGSRHSFNTLADTDGDLLSLRHLERRIDIDSAAHTVTIDGGVTYADLCPVLDAAGFALPNIASVPDFTIIGAAATATHGSGTGNRNLAAPVSAVELVTATGDIVTLRRGDSDFPGAVVNVGALGVVSALTLDLLPRFEVYQNIFLDLPFDSVIENLESVMGAGYSVSLFTHWRDGIVKEAWVKSLASAAPPPTEFFGGHAATVPVSPVYGADPTGTTAQLGVPGPWFDRLPHGRIHVLPKIGAELQSEYFIALADAPAALRALDKIAPSFADLLIVSEVRTIAADDYWISMNQGRASIGIHFAFRHDWPAVSRVLPLIEAALAPFAPRPHWGKLFTMPATEVHARYPHLGDFTALAIRLDPAGKFRNAFLSEYVFVD